MSRVPEAHGERLAPYIAGDESVITGCVEEAPETDGERSRSSVATDSRLVRLTVTDEEETVTSVPYTQVASASITVTEPERKDLALALVGAVVAVAGLVGLGFGTTLDEQLVLIVTLVAGIALVLVGLLLAADALETEPGEVELELRGPDGTMAYTTVLPAAQVDFARTVSRLVGTRTGRPARQTPADARTRVDPAD